MVVVRSLSFVWFVWSKAHLSWVAMGVSERREIIDGMHERFSHFVDGVPSCVVVAASADDDDVEAAGLKLPFPDEFGWLHHERYGVE